MSQAHAAHQPLPDLQNALKKLDDVGEYCRRKLTPRIKRLSAPPPAEESPDSDDARLTLPTLSDAFDKAGVEELQPRRRRALRWRR